MRLPVVCALLPLALFAVEPVRDGTRAPFHPAAEAAVEQAHRELTTRLLSPEGLLWDYVGELPTPKDCAECRPNAMGWWSPIENGPMFTGPWLDAMCRRAQATGATADRDLCRKLAGGLLLAASVSDVPGMIVRGVGADGRCHYPLGSTDQTLPWFFGLRAYCCSGLPDAAMRKRVADKMVEVALAMERIGWLVPSDGCFKGETRGAFVKDGLPFRGATHYLFLLRALYDVTGDRAWLDKYVKARDERYPGLEITRLQVCAAGYMIDRPKFDCDGTGNWIYVCAQGCLEVLCRMETDPSVKAQYRRGLDATAASASGRMAPSAAWKNTRETPFRYANWRTGYAWRPQRTQKEAEEVAYTGKRAVLGTRKDEERRLVTCPLSAAALCAYAGKAREEIALTLRRYDYSSVNVSEFFLAEVAWWCFRD